MTVSNSALAGGLRAPWSRPGRHSSQRTVLVSIISVASLVLAALATSAVAAYRGHTAVDAASQQLAAAHQALAGALSKARADGLSEPELAPIEAVERRTLAEPAIARRLGVFDAGEADHLDRQAASLRLLIPRIDPIRANATRAARQQVEALVADFAAAVDAAGQAGLDTSDDAARLASVRRALHEARTPVAVRASVQGLSDRLGEVRSTTADKQAADAAAAELSNRRDQARSALDRMTQLFTDAAAFPQLQLTTLKPAADQAQADFAAATTVDDYRSVTSAANRVSSGLRTLLKARSDAYQNLGEGRQTVQEAIANHVDVGTIPDQLNAISAQLDAAGTADQFSALSAQIDSLINPLQDRLGVAEIGVGKVIVISLDHQDLTAYQDGQVFLTSLVTTGRPALPTPPGTTTVMSKSHPWTMVSDWPRSSPYWYPPSQVTYVLWFRCCGYGIHDAPWRSTYGPGTQAQGSHGCVNVPLSKMEALYNWAEVGTRVIVK